MDYFLKRGMAFLIDALTVFLVFNITKGFLNSVGIHYAVLLAYINSYLYVIAFSVFIWEGQTLGKHMMKLKVVSVLDYKVSKQIVFTRELCRCILLTNVGMSMLVVYILFTLINKNNQGLHDLFSNSCVVMNNEIGNKVEV